MITENSITSLTLWAETDEDNGVYHKELPIILNCQIFGIQIEQENNVVDVQTHMVKELIKALRQAENECRKLRKLRSHDSDDIRKLLKEMG